MNRATTIFLAVPLAVGLAGPASPAAAQAPMPGHAMRPAADAAAPVPARQGDQADMMAATERMNRDMMAPGTMTGDPDRDFVAMMIPHHGGAIDMARIYLRTGRDPAIRRLARKVIADQECEIREMRAWQATHPAPKG